MTTRSARSRGAAAVVASLALLGSSAAAITGPAAQSAPPTQDCAVAFPVSEVSGGQAVDGLTVAQGTEPRPFAGTVIGVLDDGIAPGVDMILADLANPTDDPSRDTRIDEVGGIWQGMSGSPVYAEDGRLLGAVAYGLSYGPSTVAGITPYEQMDDYLPAYTGADTRVAVPARMARSIAAATDVTARQASDGMEQLRVPLTINGIATSRLEKLRSGEQGAALHRQGRAGSLVGSARPGTAADASSVVDGGNLGAAISYGTITAGGVGTVTDRCGDALVGFGHPMMFSGQTSLGLMPAEALLVQEESLGAPFKVANLAPPAGTIGQDRLTGITGAVGQLPTETPVESTVTYGQRSRTGTSQSLSPDWTPDVTLMQMLSMHDVTIDAVQPGSETSTVEVVVSAGGQEVPLTMSDRYVSDYDIAYAGLWDIADVLYTVSRLEDAEITSITTDSEVSDSTDVARVTEVQQRRGGTWVPLTRRKEAVVRPGRTMTLRIAVEDADGTDWVVEQVEVPRKARGEGYLQVAGGARTWNEGLRRADTVAEVQKALAADVRNDEVETRLMFFRRRSESSARAVTEPQELVVVGRRFAPVLVRR